MVGVHSTEGQSMDRVLVVFTTRNGSTGEVADAVAATGEAFARSRAQMERSLSKLAWLTPAQVGVFGGVDPPKKNPRRDVRDWAAIDAWCVSLSQMLTESTEPKER
jgi:hypothetical protein